MKDYRRGDRIDGRWEVWRILQGGLGRVYLVYDPVECQPLAIKTIRADVAGPETLERFRQEAHVWIQMGSHPNLVRAARFLPHTDDELFLFLEYVGGGDLHRFIGSPWLADRSRLLKLSLQFCDGMVHARSQGLHTHRDIKPHNCMLSLDGDLKITDFGLAKVLDEAGRTPLRQNPNFRQWLQSGPQQAPPQDPSLTGSGQMMGTLTYMPPEQICDAAIADVRSDVYSFGVMLYQMVSGQLPFQAQEACTLAYQHLTQVPPPLADAAFNAIVQSCMAKSPEQRPADFLEVRGLLAREFERATGEPAPQAPPPADFGALEMCERAGALLALGYREQALQLLDVALLQRPDLRSLWVSKSHALTQLGRPAEALPCLQHLLQEREEPGLWIEAGLAQRVLKQEAQAEIAFRRALELDGRHAEAWYHLGSLQAGQGKLGEAIDNFRFALRLAPDDPDMLFGLGLACLHADRTREGLESLLRAAALGHSRAAELVEQLSDNPG